MRDQLSVFLIKILSSKSKNKIKDIILKCKNKFPKIVRLINGSFDTLDLWNEIEENLGNNYEILMIHTSLNNLVPMYKGSVTELLDFFLELADRKNITLVMPGFMLGKNNNGVKDFYLKNKKFDKKKTPTTVGLINELFRRRKGVLRSLHPTHSILAIGPKSKEIVENHHKSNTTFGEGTPFGIMDSYKTKILGLGVYYFRNLTHVHVAEDLLVNKFPFPEKREYEVIPIKLIDKGYTYKYQLKYYTDNLSRRRDLTILRSEMSKSDLHQWSYKGVPIFIADAKNITKKLLDLAKEGKSIYK